MEIGKKSLAVVQKTNSVGFLQKGYLHKTSRWKGKDFFPKGGELVVLLDKVDGIVVGAQGNQAMKH